MKATHSAPAHSSPAYGQLNKHAVPTSEAARTDRRGSLMKSSGSQLEFEQEFPPLEAYLRSTNRGPLEGDSNDGEI